MRGALVDQAAGFELLADGVEHVWGNVARARAIPAGTLRPVIEENVGVEDSSGATGSVAVWASAGVVGSAAVAASAGILLGLANLRCAGCVGCIGCVGCVDCVGCIGCVGCVGLRGKIGEVGKR